MKLRGGGAEMRINERYICKARYQNIFMGMDFTIFKSGKKYSLAEKVRTFFHFPENFYEKVIFWMGKSTLKRLCNVYHLLGFRSH